MIIDLSMKARLADDEKIANGDVSASIENTKRKEEMKRLLIYFLRLPYYSFINDIL